MDVDIEVFYTCVHRCSLSWVELGGVRPPNDCWCILSTKLCTFSRSHNDTYLPHAVNCGRFCFWRRQFVVFCLYEYLGNRWTDLCQIHTEDVFGPPQGLVWRLRSKSPWTKLAFFFPFGGMRAVYVWQNIFSPLPDAEVRNWSRSAAAKKLIRIKCLWRRSRPSPMGSAPMVWRCFCR